MQTHFDLALLQQGDVFYMRQRWLFSEQPHYLIIMNADPVNDSVLLLDVVTSKIQKVEHIVELWCLPKNTTVYLPKGTRLGEACTLPKDSIVNCNDCKAVDTQTFIEDTRQPGARYVGRLSPVVVSRLVCSAKNSPMVKLLYKEMMGSPRHFTKTPTKIEVSKPPKDN